MNGGPLYILLMFYKPWPYAPDTWQHCQLLGA